MGYVCKDPDHAHSRDTCSGPLQWDGQDSNPIAVLQQVPKPRRESRPAYVEPPRELRPRKDRYALVCLFLVALSIGLLMVLGIYDLAYRLWHN